MVSKGESYTFNAKKISRLINNTYGTRILDNRSRLSQFRNSEVLAADKSVVGK